MNRFLGQALTSKGRQMIHEDAKLAPRPAAEGKQVGQPPTAAGICQAAFQRPFQLLPGLLSAKGLQFPARMLGLMIDLAMLNELTKP